MIKPSDLRLGNYIYPCKKSIPMYVSSLGKDWIDCNFDGNEADPWEAMPEEAEGIPLTAEMLENMGFSKSSNSLDKLPRLEAPHEVYYNGDFTLVNTADGFFRASMCEEHFYSNIEQLVPYLHNLQNCYYVYTGQELKVKP